jgi:hypothetical protein
MKPGGIVTALGTKFEIIEIGPRDYFVSRGLEVPGVVLLGNGIIGRNLDTGQLEYFYDFDL